MGTQSGDVELLERNTISYLRNCGTNCKQRCQITRYLSMTRVKSLLTGELCDYRLLIVALNRLISTLSSMATNFWIVGKSLKIFLNRCCSELLLKFASNDANQKTSL